MSAINVKCPKTWYWTQHATFLQDYVQEDIKIAELEAELARYRQHFEGLRLTIQRQEHQRS